MVSRSDLYNLQFEDGEVFKAFDPTDYNEIDGYTKNPAFQSAGAASLLSMANKALTFFTRADSEYETDTKARHSYISTRQQKKLDKKGEVAFPAFSMVPFQAFKRNRADFEEAAHFCCENILAAEEERTGYGDAEILDSTLRDEFFESRGSFKVGSHMYERHHLLGVFALWKIDRAILAIQNDMASDVANLLTDVQVALRIADECYQREITWLEIKKKKSQQQANKGKQRHKHLDDFKARAIKMYQDGDNGKVWRSVKRAAEVFYRDIIQKDAPNLMSEEEAVKTISGWLTDFDPDGEYSEYERKIKKGSRSAG